MSVTMTDTTNAPMRRHGPAIRKMALAACAIATVLCAFPGRAQVASDPAASAAELSAPLLPSADAAMLRDARRIEQTVRNDMALLDEATDPSLRLLRAQQLLRSITGLDTRLEQSAVSTDAAVALLRALQADLEAKGYSEKPLRLIIADLAIETSRGNLVDPVALNLVDWSIRVIDRAEERVKRLLLVSETLVSLGSRGPAFDYAYSAARDNSATADVALRNQNGKQAAILVARSAERPFIIVLGLAGTISDPVVRAELLREALSIQRDRAVLPQEHLASALACIAGDEAAMLRAAGDAAAATDYYGAVLNALCIRDRTAHNTALKTIADTIAEKGAIFRAKSAVDLLLDSDLRAGSTADLALASSRLGYTVVAADDAAAAALMLTEAAPREAVRSVVSALAETGQLERAFSLLPRLEPVTAADRVSLGLFEAEVRNGTMEPFVAAFDALEAEGVSADALEAITADLISAGNEARLAELADAMAEGGRTDAADFIRARALELNAAPTGPEALALVDQMGDGSSKVLAYATILARLHDPRRLLAFEPLADATQAAMAEAIAIHSGTEHQAIRAKALAYVGHAGAQPLIDGLDGPARDDALRAVSVHALRSSQAQTANDAQARIEDPDARAEAMADTAFVLAEEGRAQDGARLLKSIENQKVRTAAFRTYSMQRAFLLDTEGHLRPDGALVSADQGLPGLDWSVGLSRTYRRDRDKEVPFEALVGWNGEANRSIDDETNVRQAEISLLSGAEKPYATEKLTLPYMLRTGSDVRVRVPAVTGGRTRKTLMYHNKFNQKFLEAILFTQGLDRMSKLQGTRNPLYVYLDEGVYNMTQLVEQIDSEGLPFEPFVIEGNTLTVRLPILVGPKATLVISGHEFENVRLSATSGSFLVNAGKLFIIDAEVDGWSEAKNGLERATYKGFSDFRPFILTWTGSKTYIASSRLRALGSNQPKAYGLSMSAGPNDDVNSRALSHAPTGTIVDNYFENFFYGYYSYEANGVELIGNEYRDHVIYGPDPHDRSHDLRIAFNTTYDIEKKHGIIISREVDDSYIVGNLTFENKGSGLMIDRESIGTVVYANTSFGNGQDGLSIFESSCTLVLNNDFSGNERSGMKSRNSVDTFIVRNDIAQNKLDGIELYIANLEIGASGATRDFIYDPYIPITTALIGENTISRNGTGIISRGSSGMTMFRNEFLRQSPTPMGGDLAPLSGRLLQASTEAPAVLASECKPRLPRFACRFRNTGVVTLDDRALKFAGETGEACETVEGTAERAAFEMIGAEGDDDTN